MRWVLGCFILLLSACTCGPDKTTVIVVPLPVTNDVSAAAPPQATGPTEATVATLATVATGDAVPAAAATAAGQSGWVEQLQNADWATRTDGAGKTSPPTPGGSDGSPVVLVTANSDAATIVADVAPASLEEDADASESEPETTAAVPVVAPPVTNPEPIPWLEQYRADYLDRQIALSDVTVKIANPQFGVYVEDYRALGAQVGTPHQSWLATRDMMVVSPSVEALLLGRSAERLGQVPTFTCDPSRYACVSLPGAPVQAYWRFAPFGPARTVQLVGVLYFDPGVASAVVSGRINDFNRVIDRQLAKLR